MAGLFFGVSMTEQTPLGFLKRDVELLGWSRSAFGRGVIEYAKELCEDLVNGIKGGYVKCSHLEDFIYLNKVLLNGAENWEQYSYGGCSLISDYEIAKRICSPSEFKKTREGEWRLKGLEWLDWQAKALGRASLLVYRAVRKEMDILKDYELKCVSQ